MFWRVTSLAQSPVEQVLDRGDFTLADLLDEDDVVQEARALNGRLVAFLSKPETVRQLVDYLVEPPPPGEFFSFLFFFLRLFFCFFFSFLFSVFRFVLLLCCFRGQKRLFDASWETRTMRLLPGESGFCASLEELGKR